MATALRLPMLAGILSALFLSGCTNDAGGQALASGHGQLAYNGASSGSHSDQFDCDGTATLHVVGNLGAGDLEVRVSDAVGRPLAYAEGGPKQFDSTHRMDDGGWAAGQWTVAATRSANALGPFSGQYAISVDC